VRPGGAALPPRPCPRGPRRTPIATIKDVAALAGLSIATVSKYINGGNVLPANRAALASAVKRLGYRRNDLARGLKTNRSLSIGVLIPRLDGVFFTTIVSHMESFAQSRGYTTIVCDYREEPRLLESKLEFLVGRHVDGIVAVPIAARQPALAALAARRFPLVLFDRLLAGGIADSVVIDNEGGSRAVAAHLLQRGHRSVGIIVGPRSIYTAGRRLAGYAAALREAGLPLPQRLVVTGDYTVAGGHRAMLSLLASRPRPTAVYATNYEMTLGAIMALNEKGVRVPADLSFVGFDSLELSAVVKPSLTVVTQPLESIAVSSAELLLRRMAGDWEGFPRTLRLASELHVGQSVALRKAKAAA
jgi:LacI family transcriptional regulator